MGILKGLASITDFNDKREARREAAASGKKSEYLKLKPGESVKVRFLQELDTDSPNYSEKNDLGVITVLHQGPGAEGWKKKAQCTADEGECYACAQRKVDFENWKPASPQLYINAVIDPDGDDEKVVLVQQSTTARSITPTLIEYAGETGSITDRVWKITRNGDGKDTSYTAVAFDKKEFAKSVEDYELFDNEHAVRKVEFDEQPAFYGTVAKAEEKVGAAAGGNDYTSW